MDESKMTIKEVINDLSITNKDCLLYVLDDDSGILLSVTKVEIVRRVDIETSCIVLVANRIKAENG